MAMTDVETQAGLTLRQSEEIQGNILAPFNKDHRLILFLKFPDGEQGRNWLLKVLPHISVTKDVAEFNRLFSEARRLNGGIDPDMKATWVNLSLTYPGLITLKPELDSDLKNPAFQLDAFTQGPAARAASLGDSGLSAPQHWVIGADQDSIHAMLFIDADEPGDLEAKAALLRDLSAQYGVTVVFEQRGDTLPKGQGAGHEHFGFKDGISQPGVKGFDFPDPSNSKQVKGHLGSDLLQPGEFVVGYPRQPFSEDGEPEAAQPAPDWMKDGSFIVFRRLNQDVPAFWEQIERHIRELPEGDNLTADMLAAKLVGRWRSGTPLDLSPESDNPTGEDDDNNNFEFNDKDASGAETGTKDPQGLRCPRFAHIRKVYPRDNATFGDERRRIMRRGIPFGPGFNPTSGPGHAADAERGLLFAAYMSSIEEHFEFLQQIWVDNAGFPTGDAGPDPIIGDCPRPAPNTLHPEGHEDRALEFVRFVNTTGAVYAFSPSISSLRMLAGDDDNTVEQINGYAVGFAFLRLYRLHPDIGLPTDEQHENGYQVFQKARLSWNGERVEVYWTAGLDTLPDWMGGQERKEFEI
jgi:Dyp-type peroxidase family